VKKEIIQNGVTTYADTKHKSVRIHHPTLRSCIFTLTRTSKPYPVPFACPMCNTIHTHKTYHLNLDQHGNVHVAPETYETWKREGLVENLKAVKEVMPLPTVLHMPTLDYSAVGLLGPDDARGALHEPVYQPPIVISREEGMVKGPEKEP
jgi:hypothetical protein